LQYPLSRLSRAARSLDTRHIGKHYIAQAIGTRLCLDML
jgi:hypothetical protein